MHILFALENWGMVGGTERHASVVVPELLRRGHGVSVLCDKDLAPGFADVPVHAVPAIGPGTLTRAERAELARTVRGIAPDVIFLSKSRNVDAMDVLVDLAPTVRYVHDHTLFCPGLNKVREDFETCHAPMGLECLKRYWFSNGCICFKPSTHGRGLRRPVKAVLAKRREIAINQRTARMLTNSEYMRGELLKVGFAPETTSVLYIFTESNTPSQPCGTLPAATEAFLAASDAPLFFTPARLVLPDKGVDYLLSALSKVQAPFRAVVAGDGPHEDWLRQKARDEGVADRVHFAGWIDSGSMETLYARADAVVCPSVWDEPFGLVGIEAMSHEKPVVAFRVGGIPEWLTDGETGFLVRAKDTDAMAGALKRLLTEPGLARSLGAAGAEAVARRFPKAAHLDGLEQALLAAGKAA